MPSLLRLFNPIALLFASGIAALLLGAAAPSALAQNQLFVEDGAGVVSKYDADSGALINGSFLDLHEAGSIYLSGGRLYTTSVSGNVGVYDATTGAVINPSLINLWTFGTRSLAISGSNLFISIPSGVRQYNAISGELINPSFVTGLSFAMSLAVWENDLFVADVNQGTIGKYDLLTGAPINASFIANDGATDWVDLAVSGSNLIVSGGSIFDQSAPGVVAYDVVTGGVVDSTFIWERGDALATSGSNLYLTTGTMVGLYNAATGSLENSTFVSSNSGMWLYDVAVSATPVPEPSFPALLATTAGFLSVGTLYRRRARKARR